MHRNRLFASPLATLLSTAAVVTALTLSPAALAQTTGTTAPPAGAATPPARTATPPAKTEAPKTAPAKTEAKPADKKAEKAPAKKIVKVKIVEKREKHGMHERHHKAFHAMMKALKGIRIHGTFFLSYQNGTHTVAGASQRFSTFTLKRGYFDLHDAVLPWLEARYTADLTRDAGGSWLIRQKYLYGKLHFKGGSALSGIGIEVGQVHTPWLDFEEAMNGFRLQDEMFLDKNHVVTSADIGLTFSANLGGSMDAAYKKNVNHHYAGRYGSIQLGVYNGAGYHAAEANQDKVVMGRLTVRPLPDVVPGLQATVFGWYGKGNVAPATVGGQIPDYDGVDAMLSFQHEYVTVMAEYYTGAGKGSGKAVDSSGAALMQSGYSLFAAGHLLPSHKLQIMARWDHFDTDASQSTADVQDRYIVGVGWRFHGGNQVLLDYDHLGHSVTAPAEDRVQATFEVAF